MKASFQRGFPFECALTLVTRISLIQTLKRKIGKDIDLSVIEQSNQTSNENQETASPTLG